MPARPTAFVAVAAALAFALVAAAPGFAVASRTLDHATLAQAETGTDIGREALEQDPAGVLKPETYPATAADVDACMETWDPETGMSKADYRKSCERTLKYFPQNP